VAWVDELDIDSIAEHQIIELLSADNIAEALVSEIIQRIETQGFSNISRNTFLALRSILLNKKLYTLPRSLRDKLFNLAHTNLGPGKWLANPATREIDPRLLLLYLSGADLYIARSPGMTALAQTHPATAHNLVKILVNRTKGLGTFGRYSILSNLSRSESLAELVKTYPEEVLGYAQEILNNIESAVISKELDLDSTLISGPVLAALIEHEDTKARAVDILLTLCQNPKLTKIVSKSEALAKVFEFEPNKIEDFLTLLLDARLTTNDDSSLETVIERFCSGPAMMYLAKFDPGYALSIFDRAVDIIVATNSRRSYSIISKINFDSISESALQRPKQTAGLFKKILNKLNSQPPNMWAFRQILESVTLEKLVQINSALAIEIIELLKEKISSFSELPKPFNASIYMANSPGIATLIRNGHPYGANFVDELIKYKLALNEPQRQLSRPAFVAIAENPSYLKKLLKTIVDLDKIFGDSWGEAMTGIARHETGKALAALESFLETGSDHHIQHARDIPEFWSVLYSCCDEGQKNKADELLSRLLALPETESIFHLAPIQKRISELHLFREAATLKPSGALVFKAIEQSLYLSVMWNGLMDLREKQTPGYQTKVDGRNIPGRGTNKSL